MTREEALNECISRDKAIVQLNHLKSDWDDDWNVVIHKCIETIKNLPSVTPMPRWIPCSERLPKPYSKDEAGNDIAFLVQTEWGTFFTATYDGNWCHVDSSVLVESDVIAWMPLPEKYQSEIPTGSEGSEE